MKAHRSRDDRIALALALFGALAVLALALGAGAAFTDLITNGMEWLGEHKKQIDAAASIIGGIVTIAGAIAGFI